MLDDDDIACFGWGARFSEAPAIPTTQWNSQDMKREREEYTEWLLIICPLVTLFLWTSVDSTYGHLMLVDDLSKACEL